MSLSDFLYLLAVMMIAAPATMLLVLGVTNLFERPLSEANVGRAVQLLISVGLMCALTILGIMLVSGERNVPIIFGNWVHIPQYHFSIKFNFDRLSVPFVILTFVLCGTIGSFANKYLHRERGFQRFFVAFSLFALGMVTTAAAGTIETLFAGWELVGLSSALLVAFYQERPAPPRSAIYVWTVYRISDAALLAASVVMHHLNGEGDFDKLLGMGSWPYYEVPNLPVNATLAVGILLLLAAAGKSAMIPFSNWLPRAMEGPTPSSAVFYGALSVHLGAFLMLRISPLFVISIWLRVAVVAVGLLTAIYGSLAARVQTDVKCALSFASLSQVGIIFVEIGLGLQYLALIHILGHGCWRTLQFLRAPSLLHDFRLMENAVGDRLEHPDTIWQRFTPAWLRQWLYRFALERGYFDSFLTDYVVGTFLQVFRLFDRWERAWTDFLTGENSRESEQSAQRTLDDLL